HRPGAEGDPAVRLGEILMASGPDYLSLILIYLPVLPVHLLWFIGMVLALMRRHRHPAVFTLTLIALGLLFITSSIDILLWFWLTVTPHEWSSSQMSVYFSALSIFHSAMHCVAWVLLLIVIFRWREQPVWVPVGHEPDESVPGPIQR